MLVIRGRPIGELLSCSWLQCSHGTLAVDDDLRIRNFDSRSSERFHEPQTELTFDRPTLAGDSFSIDFDHDPFVAKLLYAGRVHRHPNEIFPDRILRDLGPDLIDDRKSAA